MEVSAKEQRILLLTSGNLCAFPDCSEPLMTRTGPLKRPVITGEIAHIVSPRSGGPRGADQIESRDYSRHINLLYLCPRHHKLIDDQPQEFTSERLRQIKAEHEKRVEAAMAHSYAACAQPSVTSYVQEVLHSTLLPVLRMPRFLWAAPTDYGDREERLAAQGVSHTQDGILCPFIIRGGGTVYTFVDLSDTSGPFSQIASATAAKRTPLETWLSTEDKRAWIMALLNRSLNKLTGRKGLRLDRGHRRYFFQAEKPGEDVQVEYRPLNQSGLVKRKVVWRPVSKKTGQPRPYWLHIAAAISFVYAGKGQWFISVRPEMRVTSNGVDPIEADAIGGRVTRRKAKMFNYDLLEELNFWRDFLSDGRPRVALNFGGDQRIVFSTTLMSANVSWPGMPEEFAKTFRNVEYDEDLFTLAELQAGEGDEAEAEE